MLYYNQYYMENLFEVQCHPWAINLILFHFQFKYTYQVDIQITYWKIDNFCFPYSSSKEKKITFLTSKFIFTTGDKFEWVLACWFWEKHKLYLSETQQMEHVLILELPTTHSLNDTLSQALDIEYTYTSSFLETTCCTADKIQHLSSASPTRQVPVDPE